MLLMILYLLSLVTDQDLNGCLDSTKDSKSNFESITCWFKSSCFKISSNTRRGIKLIWIEFGSSRLEDEDRQQDFDLALFIVLDLV